MSEDPKHPKVIRAHLDPEVLARLDALAAALAKEGRAVTRAELLRSLVQLGLDEEERAHLAPRSSQRRREG